TTARPTPPSVSAPQAAHEGTPALVPRVLRRVVSSLEESAPAAGQAGATPADNRSQPPPVEPLSRTRVAGPSAAERPAATLDTPALTTVCRLAATILDPMVGAVLAPVIG